MQFDCSIIQSVDGVLSFSVIVLHEWIESQSTVSREEGDFRDFCKPLKLCADNQVCVSKLCIPEGTEMHHLNDKFPNCVIHLLRALP